MPRRDVVVRTENGVLAVDSKDWLVGKKLYVDRSFECAEMDSAVAALRASGWLPSSSPMLIDAGANVGMISVPMILRRHFQRAIAFEPAKSTFRLLTGNARRNGLCEAIRCVPMALSDSESVLDLSISPDNSGDNRIEPSGVGAGWYREEYRQRIRVPAVALEPWLAAAGVEPRQIGLIWLDVQGHEAHALRGAGDLLRAVPVVTEVWPYAMERSRLGAIAFLQLATRFFAGFWTLPPCSTPTPIGRLRGLMESLSRSPRGMTQIVLVPNRRSHAAP